MQMGLQDKERSGVWGRRSEEHQAPQLAAEGEGARRGRKSLEETAQTFWWVVLK